MATMKAADTMKAMQTMGPDKRTQVFADFRTTRNRFVTLAYGHAGKPKVLFYSIRAIVNSGAFLSALMAKATIFTMDMSIFWSLLSYVCIGATSSALTWYFINGSDVGGDDGFDAKSLDYICNYLNTFIPFVLGLYISLVLARWWAQRIEGIGKVLDSLQNVCLLVASELPNEDFFQFHEQIISYGLASVALVVRTCRGKHEIIDLGPSHYNLLTEDELRILGDVPVRPRPALLWSWILSLCTKVYEDQSIPPGKQRDIIQQVVIARNAISLIWTYLGTQLPFAYVHLVTFIVNINNVLASIKCGIVFMMALQQKSWVHAASQVIFLCLMPVLYQGILSVAYMIHDPFGEDLLDFPIMAFQEYANAQCISVVAYCRRCPALKRQWGQGPTIKELALRKQCGKAHAEWLDMEHKVLAKVDYETTDDTDGRRAEREAALKAELAAEIAQQNAGKDAVASFLAEQLSVVAPEIVTVNAKLQSLESKVAAAIVPVAPPAGFCSPEPSVLAKPATSSLLARPEPNAPNRF